MFYFQFRIFEHESLFHFSARNFILENFLKFRELMKWFSVILISSAFSSVPELDSRRRIPLASSWHNDSLTKVSRKRFQNHRKLIQTHPFKEDSSSKSVFFVQKKFKMGNLESKFWVFYKMSWTVRKLRWKKYRKWSRSKLSKIEKTKFLLEPRLYWKETT